MWLIRFIKRTLIFALVFYLGLFAILWFARTLLIYPFSPEYRTPENAGEARLTEKKLKTSDGESLIVWVRPAKAKNATIIYFHGNAGNLAGRAQRFDRLINRGLGIVALAYRGSSGSTGKPSEDVISQDAVLLREHLREILGKKPNGKIIYYGESLGTGVATKLATAIPPDALILEAPYTAVVDLAANQMPFFPIHAILDQRWETRVHIKNVPVPTLILHGTNDTVIPYSHGKTIYDLSPAKKKQLKTLKGGNHLSAFSVEGQKTIYRFIEAL